MESLSEDEPTGDVDSETAQGIIHRLGACLSRHGVTVIVAVVAGIFAAIIYIGPMMKTR